MGIYGVQSHLVSARKNEIGLRMAVGASPSSVLRSVLGQGMRLTLAGIIAGLVGAFAAAAALRSVLVGVSPTDTQTLISVSAVLILVSLAACYFPARRAMQVDPATVLREE
jgi:putative ABC transport system permease protein